MPPKQGAALRRLARPLGPGARLARAELVTTGAALRASSPAETPDRERVHRLLDREDVQAQLAQLGIPANEARARVATLTDAEIARVTGRLETSPQQAVL